MADWKIKIVDTVADNASAGLFTLGCEPKLLRKLDLRHCGMVIESKGEPICVGAGAAAMGNPVVADAVAGADDGPGGPSVEGGRCGDVGLAGADDAGLLGRRGRSAHLRAGLGPRRVRKE